jgi:hypothetical protein
MIELNPDFWQALDLLLESSRIVLDRPKAEIQTVFQFLNSGSMKAAVIFAS